MALNNKEIKELKDAVVNTSGKGFGYFIKNIALLVLIGLGVYILANPDIIKDPATYISTFNPASIYVVTILLLISGGVYQLGKSLNKDAKNERTKAIAKGVLAEQKEDKQRNDIKHTEYIKRRIKLGPDISNQLKSLLIDLGASRATVAEMHNGSNNINGCPFVHATINYEEISPKVDYISDEYKNFNLLKYPFVSNHFDDMTWIGNVEEIEKEDPYFASKLKFGDDKFICIQVLSGRDMPFGFLSVSFANDKHPSKAQIVASVSQAAQIISSILDKDSMQYE